MHGYLVAQCLRVPFWNQALDISSVANCLVFQVDVAYANSHLYGNCTPRSRRVENNEFVPSPDKRAREDEDVEDGLQRMRNSPL